VIPEFPEFSKLVVDHKETIEAYTRIFPPYSDYTFPSLWSWNIHEQIELCDLNGNLVVRFTDYVTNEKFLSFLGNREVTKTLGVLFAWIDRTSDHLSYLKLIPEHNLAGIPLLNGYEVVEDPDNQDYIYRITDLASLKRPRYHRHRNQISQFLKKYVWQMVTLDLSRGQTWGEIEKVCQTWKRRKFQRNNNVQNDMSALPRLGNIAQQMKLLSVGICVDSKLVGFTVFEFNHAGFATGLFELADMTYSGIYPHLRKQAAIRLVESGCEWLNLQQDLGIEGLRNYKTWYYPDFFLKKLIIRRASEWRGDV
jgi:hypothetical protein